MTLPARPREIWTVFADRMLALALLDQETVGVTLKTWDRKRWIKSKLFEYSLFP